MDASIAPDTLQQIDLGGFRLGMTLSEVDAVYLAHDDWGEPRGELDRSFDCDRLYPDADKRDRYDPDKQPGTIDKLDGLRFYTSPTGSIVTSISHRERRPSSDWQSVLAEAEARFGKADFAGKDVNGAVMAVWCVPGAETCDDRTHAALLSLQWLPASEFAGEKYDAIDYYVDEGVDARRARDDSFEGLATHDPAEAHRLFEICRRKSGKFSERAFRRHLIMLTGSLKDASPPIESWRRVPPSALEAAAGLDPEEAFGRSTGIVWQGGWSFDWARKTQDTWIIALAHGGAALIRHYYAVRCDIHDCRKVWWSEHESLSEYAAWRAAGSIPMKESKDE